MAMNEQLRQGLKLWLESSPFADGDQARNEARVMIEDDAFIEQETISYLLVEGAAGKLYLAGREVGAAFIGEADDSASCWEVKNVEWLIEPKTETAAVLERAAQFLEN